MKNRIFIALFVSFVSFGTVDAQTAKTAIELPDISVIGNFIGTHSENKKGVDVKEIEFSFQDYLYPSVKANVFAALHKGADGKRNFELEEAYVTFSDLFALVLPNSDSNLRIGAVLGKKLIGIGKINPLHPEQWQFVDRPIVVQQFLGGEEGLSAEGAQIHYLLPLPFFSQIELGYWTMSEHAHEEKSEGKSSHGVEYSNRLLNGRLWNSFAISQTQEMELGLSYLLGNASASSKDNQQNILGFDLTLTQDIGPEQSLKLQTEYYQAQYGEEGEERARQEGGFISGSYKFSPYYQAGVRFGILGKHGHEGNTKKQYSLMLTRQLTETSKFRIQYNTGENTENTLYTQFIFGMGPHAHVLQ